MTEEKIIAHICFRAENIDFCVDVIESLDEDFVSACCQALFTAITLREFGMFDEPPAMLN